jgi:hypothetical protein
MIMINISEINQKLNTTEITFTFYKVITFQKEFLT